MIIHVSTSHKQNSSHFLYLVLFMAMKLLEREHYVTDEGFSFFLIKIETTKMHTMLSVADFIRLFCEDEWKTHEFDFIEWKTHRFDMKLSRPIHNRTISNLKGMYICSPSILLAV